MCIVKMIAMILLAAFLIISGLIALTGMTIPAFGMSLLGLLALSAGVLILISIGSFHHDHDNKCQK